MFANTAQMFIILHYRCIWHIIIIFTHNKGKDDFFIIFLITQAEQK